MKAINLKSLADAHEQLDDSTFGSYLKLHGLALATENRHAGIKLHELECIKSLVKEFEQCDECMAFADNFFIGYTIPQIGKEFDLLRINKDNVVNIELKTKADEDRILKQLRRNSYYLSFLKQEKKHLFAYVCETGMLYRLDDSGELSAAEFAELFRELGKEHCLTADIDSLFNPCNYLISPFNATEAFMEGKYFLTEQQEEIKGRILNAMDGNGAEFLALTGEAGTGKTLLTYDIAKELTGRGKRVFIVHCAKLNDGQYFLQENYSWDICMAKYSYEIDFSQLDVVIIDEAQRIYMSQFNYIVDNVRKNGLKCIFSYDLRQYLHHSERNLKFSGQNILTKPIFQLTKKIRTNKEIAVFIKQLFDNKIKESYANYSNIELCYCRDKDEVYELSKYLHKNGWKVPKYTPGTMSTFTYEKYVLHGESSAHEVIGQEYDKVVAVIDRHFRYDTEGILTADNTYYSQRQMLYQILTRTRQRLFIIIYDNEPMLKRCLEILGE